MFNTYCILHAFDGCKEQFLLSSVYNKLSSCALSNPWKNSHRKEYGMRSRLPLNETIVILSAPIFSGLSKGQRCRS